MSNKNDVFLNYFVSSLFINVVIYYIKQSKNRKESNTKDYLKITIDFLKIYPMSIIIVFIVYLINRYNKQTYKLKDNIKIITQADINDIKKPFLIGRDFSSVYKTIPDYKRNSLLLRDNISNIPFNKKM